MNGTGLMDFTMLLLLGLGLGIAIPALSGGDDDEADVPQQRFGNEGDNQIEGDFGDNILNGTEGPDAIKGLRGDDVINGFAGEDTIAGGSGNDIIRGGDDRDIITGFEGDDQLFGEGGSDTIQGGPGNDRIDGGADFDILRAGDGDDIVLGGARAERADDGSLITENTPGDIARGLDGDDTVFIWGGQGQAVGGEGDDTLVLVTGQGTLTDEQGATDFFILANADDDTIPTRGTITEFNAEQDSLTLTIDGDLGGNPPPDLTFELREETRMEGQNTVNGIFVLAKFVDDAEAVEGSEAAGVFLRGATLEQLEGEEIIVEFTNNADYFDPEATLAELKERLGSETIAAAINAPTSTNPAT